MVKTKDTVKISRHTWDELYEIDYFREVLEIIEDREKIRKAKEKADGFVSFREYHKRRKNV